MTYVTMFATGAGALALLCVGTLLLPRHVSVARVATMQGAPEAVVALASSNVGYQRFNPYLAADPALKITPFGPESGVGSGFTFDGKDGKGQQVVAAVDARSVRFDIDLGPMGQPVQVISVEPVADGTRVEWSMQMDLGMNPIARVIGLFMDKMVGKTLEQGLSNLAAAA